MLRDFLDGVAGLPLEPPEPPTLRYTRPCPAKGCDDGVIYAGPGTETGAEDWAYCSRCGGTGQVPA